MPGRGLEQRVAAQWAHVRGVLRAEVGESAYKSWLKPLTLLDVNDGVVRLAVPTRFMRDWIDNHYGDRVRQLWLDEDESLTGLDLRGLELDVA